MGHVVYLLAAISGIVATELTIAEYETSLSDNEVPSKPRDLTVLDVSSDTIMLKWSQPEKLSGAIEGYRVYYMHNNYTDMNRDKIKSVSSCITYNLTNLKPFTEYKIWVKAFTKNHEGEPSDPIVNVTDISGPSAPLVTISGIVATELTTTEYETTLSDNEVPSKPRDLTVLDVSSDTIMLKWSQPETPNGAIEGYRVYYMHNNYTDMNRDKIKSVSSYITYNLTNLKPFTEYKIWVKAFTKNHEGEPSDPIVTVTDISGPSAPLVAISGIVATELTTTEYETTLSDNEVPSKPRDLTVLDVSSDTIMLKWSQPEKPNGVIEGYRVYYMHNNYTDMNRDKIKSVSSYITYNLTNLKPFTEYKIWVKAFTKNYEGEPSDPIVAVTDISGPSTPLVAISGIVATELTTTEYETTLSDNEVPGKPRDLTVLDVSSDTIMLKWSQPEKPNGAIEGYRVYYMHNNYTDMNRDKIKSVSSYITYNLINLKPFTEYKIWVKAFTKNHEGEPSDPIVTVTDISGPSAPLVAKSGIVATERTTTEYETTLSDNEVPSKPRNLTVLDVSSDTIMLKWSQPEKPNGAIEGYRVYYMHNNYTDMNRDKIKSVSSYITYNLTNLKPFTEYKIWVKAFTKNHEGEPSDPIVNVTDISGPSAPTILNVTCQTQDTIYVQWARPHSFHNSIDYYDINVYLNKRKWISVRLEASKEHLDTAYSVENVITNTEYEVRVQASERSNRTHKIVRGALSEPRTVLMRSDCDKMQEYMSTDMRHTEQQHLIRHTKYELSAGVLAGVICASFAFLLAVSAFILWRKCFRVSYHYLDDPPCSVPTASLDWNVPPDGNSEHKRAIPVKVGSAGHK